RRPAPPLRAGTATRGAALVGLRRCTGVRAASWSPPPCSPRRSTAGSVAAARPSPWSAALVLGLGGSPADRLHRRARHEKCRHYVRQTAPTSNASSGVRNGLPDGKKHGS